MFDFLECSRQLFGNAKSYYEAAAEVNAQFSSTIAMLADQSELSSYLGSFKNRDTVKITMKACVDFIYPMTDGGDWRVAYTNFLAQSEPDDDVEINVHITKNYDDCNTLSIYCFERFMDYYSGLSLVDLLTFFSSVFSHHSYIRFETLDAVVGLYTHSIGFCQEGEHWPDAEVVREEQLKKCENASLFLNRIDFPLMPYDFEFLGNTSEKNPLLISLFNKIRTLLAYLYLANSSYIIGEKMVLQFSPSQQGFAYNINLIAENTNACQLFNWAFGGENAVERTGITRNVICLNCKTADQILGINEEIWNSVKSNYILYQKKTTEQYIEMKKQISAFIVDSSKQLQELIYNLIEGLKNNFIAVIMFLITIILTDSIDWEDFLATHSLNQDLIFVTRIFIAASSAYLLVTYIAMIIKWLFFKKGYHQLKDSYKEIFDDKDLENAFEHDKVINTAKKNIIIAAILIGVVWVGFIVSVYFFTNCPMQIETVIQP
ncbi:hypothetical protein [Sinanaerobacter chloroacetimidivorans]|uniref:Uncharacterized protein n=1 Tax=Sinanaerobacter chloroacetimidivorans TaxID=2818044 RepID=A0A8J7VXE0_9FIRM|nr:hypothetical protein [Sinanaerobacter chloroacetimidivorans]MBR0596451.1 hypothetical protein [Sinanaerobacter chloroacetimidivorans]